MENTTQSAPNGMSIGIRFGLFLGLFSIVYFLALAVSNINPQSGIWNWLGILFMIVALFLAHKNFKDSGDGFMSYGQGVGIGFWVTAISTLLSAVFSYIYMKFIDTGYLDMIKDKQMEEFAERGMSEEEIDQAMQFASAFTSPEMILVFGVLAGVFFGMIIVLLVTIFTQKKNPTPAF